MFTKLRLMSLKKTAMQKKVWFKVLKGIERALLDLTIRCVDVVRSSKLAEILKCIEEKLVNAMKSRVEKLMADFGISAAEKIAYLAFSWGNTAAMKWAADSKFVKYLTVMHINTPVICKS